MDDCRHRRRASHRRRHNNRALAAPERGPDGQCSVSPGIASAGTEFASACLGSAQPPARVSTEVQLAAAQASLTAGNYRGALTSAREVLALDPAHSEAEKIRDEATAMLAKFDTAINDARRRLTAGDYEGTARLLETARSIDPSSPTLAELGGRLSDAIRARETSRSAGRPTGQEPSRPAPSASVPPPSRPATPPPVVTTPSTPPQGAMPAPPIPDPAAAIPVRPAEPAPQPQPRVEPAPPPPRETPSTAAPPLHQQPHPTQMTPRFGQ